MKLTDQEQSILEGKVGEGRQFALKILTNMGELYGASRLIEISAAQLNCPRSERGYEGWLALLKYFSARKLGVTAPSYSHAVNDKQKQLDEHYKRLGLNKSHIYTQFKPPKTQKQKTHMAISDAGTAVYMNSRFGIRTNNESSAVALAAAVLGKTTLSGLHFLEKRIPDIQVTVKCDLHNGDLALIGHYIGERFKTRIPYFKFDDKTINFSDRDLFEFSSALGTSGNVPMFHIAEMTPEQNLYRSTAIKKKVRVNSRDIQNQYERYRPVDEPDIIVVGAPETDLDELQYAAKLFKNRKINSNFQLWIFTSNKIYNEASRAGYAGTIREAGAKIFKGCWFEDGPAVLPEDSEVVTDSIRTVNAVAEHGRKDITTSILPARECFMLAQTGRLP